MNNIKAVIFDIDGTLYEPRHFPLRLIASDPLHIGMLARERKCRKILKGKEFACADDYYDALFNLMGKGSPSASARCREWFSKSYMPSQVRIREKHFPKRPLLRELITGLKSEGYLVAVLSDYAFAREKLQACGLGDISFDGVWEAPEIGGLKPCRQTFLNVCKALNVKPEEALMIGDRADTDGGAADAGLKFIHLVKEENQHGTGSAPGKEMTWNQILDMFNVGNQSSRR